MQNMERKLKLTCRDVDDVLVAYLDDRMEDDVRQRFERHLRRCAKCMTYLEQYRETTRLVREAGALPQAPPDELLNRTLEFLREHRERGT